MINENNIENETNNTEQSTNEYQNENIPTSTYPQYVNNPITYSLEKDKKEETFSIKKVVLTSILSAVIASSATSGCLLTYFNSQNTKNNQVTTTQTTQTTPIKTSTKSTSIIENANKSIALIKNMSVKTQYDFFYRQVNQESESSGSGVIIKEDNKYYYILTNYHVIEDANSLEITLNDEKTYTGTIKGYQEDQDIALVTVKKSDIKDTSKIAVINIGNSDNIKIGDQIYALGNAMGYGNSVTQGIISAKNREVTFDKDTTLNLIQIDAAINPGNSGGALIDQNGNLIGINTAKYANEYVEGIGYAIPINTANKIVNNIISGKITKVQSGTPGLGIEIFDITENMASQYKSKVGVCIKSVQSMSGASIAGLQSGDIIVGIDNKSVSTSKELKKIISKKQIGDTVKIVYYRNTTDGYLKQECSITLGKIDETESTDLNESYNNSDNSYGFGF